MAAWLPLTTSTPTNYFYIDNGTATASSPWPWWLESSNATTTVFVTRQYVNATTIDSSIDSDWLRREWQRQVQRAMERLEVLAPYVRSDRERLEDEERARQALQRQEERKRQRDEARQRARELLLSHLNPRQRETFEQHGWFIVEGGLTRKPYRINAFDHMVANVDVLGHDGDVDHRLCCHCDTSKVPIFDNILAQKAMLEWDEEHFVKTANRHRRAA